MHLHRGFSLIELMVVIAIVAVLAAVAVPTYKTYITRVKVANAVATMRQLADMLLEQYQRTGVAPTSIQFGGVNILASTSHLVNIDAVAYLRYDFSGTTGILRIMSQLKGLTGISGYVAPDTTATTTNEPTYGMIRLVAPLNSSNVYLYRCGQHSAGNPADVPLSLNPASCQCTATGDIFINGWTNQC